MKTRSSVILFVLGVAITKTLGAAIVEPIRYVAIMENNSSPDYIDEVIRIKRSGSGDIFGFIKKGITSKLSQFAQASAGASAKFSKGSSGGGGGGDGGGGYYYPKPHSDSPSYDTKSFDFWTLKKSILNTLLQAVKAIKGGVIAIKGQLIKGGGAIISAKGKVISMKGEAIANLGRHIISSAKLVPHPYSSSSSSGYSAPSSGHSGPSAPSAPPSPSYGPPSSEYGAPGPSSNPSAPTAPSGSGAFSDLHPPSTGYGTPSTGYGQPTSGYGPPIGPSAPSQAYLPQKLSNAYEALRDKLPHGAEAGIVILKKIPSSNNKDYPHIGLAHLPLQDERNKVVSGQHFSKHKHVHDIGTSYPKEPQPPLFKPLPSNTHNPINSLFESSLPLVPTGPTAPSAPPGALTAHSAPAYHGSDESSSGVQQQQFTPQPDYNNIPVSTYNFASGPPAPPPLQQDGNGQYLLPKVPAPFEINPSIDSFQNNYDSLGPVNNIQSSPSGPPNTDYSFDTYAPSLNLPVQAPRTLGSSYSFPSNSQYTHNTGILEHKEVHHPQFDIVRSMSYELPAPKKH